MKLWAKSSETLFRLFTRPYLQTFAGKSPEKILRLSLNLLDADTIDDIRRFVISRHTDSGGFADRAGKADLYYTLFGFFLSDALEMHAVIPAVARFVDREINNNNIHGVHLHCAAILSSKAGHDSKKKFFRTKLRSSFASSGTGNSAYNSFLGLMSAYYTEDYAGLFRIYRKLKDINNDNILPCPVIAAYLVLQKSFGKPVDVPVKELLSFFADNGGFKATRSAPLPDLLSTAVALYALGFVGQDLRMIKPDCLAYIDSLFTEGGFGGNSIDSEPDIEYTFYGLLALGSLADRNEKY